VPEAGQDVVVEGSAMGRLRQPPGIGPDPADALGGPLERRLRRLAEAHVLFEEEAEDQVEVALGLRRERNLPGQGPPLPLDHRLDALAHVLGRYHWPVAAAGEQGPKRLRLQALGGLALAKELEPVLENMENRPRATRSFAKAC
jgi:hypothetical protein